MKVVLIDDERPALRVLKILLANYPDIEIAGMFTNPMEGILSVPALLPDAVFLDISMPQLSGMEAASAILERKQDTDIVFVTAYDEYAIRAFELYAVDYLLKPVELSRLNITVERLRRKRSAAQPPKQKRLIVRTLGRFETGFSDCEPIRWRTEKTRELFAFLLYNNGRSMVKENILDALWPEDDPERAIKQLYNNIYHIRKTLAEYGVTRDMVSIDGDYCLRLGDADYDLSRFWELYHKQADREAALSQMEPLYVGDYLAGQLYDWAVYERERVLTAYIRCAVELAGLYTRNANYSAAEALLYKAYRADPFDESVTQALLLLYRQTGNKAAAARHYTTYCACLEHELDAAPSEDIRRLANF